jgi:hypothetical protein
MTRQSYLHLALRSQLLWLCQHCTCCVVTAHLPPLRHRTQQSSSADSAETEVAASARHRPLQHLLTLSILCVRLQPHSAIITTVLASPLPLLLTPTLTPTVEELVHAIQAQGLQSIGAVWASQGPEATAAQLHQLGEANAAALFAQLGPEAIASLLRSCGPDFGAQLFLALGAPFAGGLLRHAGTEFSAGLFAALGLDSMVPMLHFMGAEYLSQMMNAAGPATAAGTFKVGVCLLPACGRACAGMMCGTSVARVKGVV